ncbi:MAG: ABC transporter permease [Saprospiraceae bacterium]
MNKLWLIIKREYLTRVTRKQFILTTLITPVAFAIFFAIVGFIFSYQSDAGSKVAVVDPGNILEKSLPDSRNFYFSFPDDSLAALKANMASSEYDGILYIPPIDNLSDTRFKLLYYSDKSLDLDRSEAMESLIAERVRDYKIGALKFDTKQLEALDVKVTIDPEPIFGKDDEANNPTTITSAIGAGIGAVMGIIMYMMVFLNGAMVMRSVMEEKMNRIVEVMISSVKPFQLMIGKVIGVGAVGMTQMLIWAILIPLFGLIVSLIFGTDMSSAPPGMTPNMGGAGMQPEDIEASLPMIMQEIGNLNWWLIIPLFFIFFLGGYLVYASLFAAVGSAIGDDLGESNSLTLPITIPVILAFYIMFVAIRSPNSSLAVWASIFPLFSPIVMPARLAFNPPAWQIILSLLFLAGAVIFFVWISGRIYRVGILMYGKKASFKELWKWVRYSN